MRQAATNSKSRMSVGFCVQDDRIIFTLTVITSWSTNSGGLAVTRYSQLMRLCASCAPAELLQPSCLCCVWGGGGGGNNWFQPNIIYHMAPTHYSDYCHGSTWNRKWAMLTLAACLTFLASWHDMVDISGRLVWYDATVFTLNWAWCSRWKTNT